MPPTRPCSPRAGAPSNAPRTTSRARGERSRSCGAAGRPIAGIGVVGQTPTLVLVADDGEAVRPALTWQDTRAGEEAAELADELGPSEALFGAALPWAPAYPPAKLCGLRVTSRKAWSRRAGRCSPRTTSASISRAPRRRIHGRRRASRTCSTACLSAAGSSAWGGRPPSPPEVARPGRCAAMSLRPPQRRSACGWHARRRGLERRARGDAGRRRVCRGDRVRAHRHVQHRRRLDTRCGCRDSALLGDPDRVHAAARRLRAHAIRRRLARMARAGVAGGHRGGAFARQARRRSPGWSRRRSFLTSPASGHRSGARTSPARSSASRRCTVPPRSRVVSLRASASASAMCSRSQRRPSGAYRTSCAWLGAECRSRPGVTPGARRIARPLLLLEEADTSALGAAMLGAAAANGGDLASADRLRSGAERADGAADSGGFARYRAASASTLAWTDSGLLRP